MPDQPTALIAEDEPLLARHLESELRRLWPPLQIVATAGDGPSALAQTLALRPHVLFLDIRMPGMNGLEVAQALVEDWPDAGDVQAHAAAFPLLVFVTAYDQYAVQAFESQAVDYLLKPVQPRRLADCVERLQRRLATTATSPTSPSTASGAEIPPSAATLEQALAQIRSLAIGLQTAPSTAAQPPRLEVIQAQVGHVVNLVPIDQVLYFEAADKYVRVITREREHLIRTPLRELLPQLDAQRFWQIHRGTVVQACEIQSATRDEAGRVHLTLRDHADRLTVSRLYAHLFKGM